jgi:hypothetical protein
MLHSWMVAGCPVLRFDAERFSGWILLEQIDPQSVFDGIFTKLFF